MNIKSVQSSNLCKSVIQTIYEIVKSPGGELKVESRHHRQAAFHAVQKTIHEIHLTLILKYKLKKPCHFFSQNFS